MMRFKISDFFFFYYSGNGEQIRISGFLMTWHHHLNSKLLINIRRQLSSQNKAILLQYLIDMKYDLIIQRDVFNSTISQVVELVGLEESGMVIINQKI